jgi:hypothetical protein
MIWDIGFLDLLILGVIAGYVWHMLEKIDRKQNEILGKLENEKGR